MAKQKRHTKADYMEAADRLAFMAVIHLGTTKQVESWASLRTSTPLSRELLLDAWERLRAQRVESGDCPDCGERSEHKYGCPKYEAPYAEDQP